MTKRYLKFFYYFLLIIFLFFTYCYIYAKIANYFYQKKTHTIKMYTTQELKDKWLATQSEVFIQNINVESRNDIPKIMDLLGINDVRILNLNSNYNSSFYKELCWNLKNPQDGLLDVYFKPRPNPFKITYPHSHNEYTLDELLTHKIAIEKAYVFWNISKAPIDHNVNIHTINLIHDVNMTKDAKIKKYLIQAYQAHQDWLNQCEIKKDKKTLAAYNNLYSNETNAQKYRDYQVYYAPQPFQVEIKPYKRDIENYNDKENDAVKNTKIFEAAKTKINGTDVYYIKFSLYGTGVIQQKLNGRNIYDNSNCLGPKLEKIELKFSHDVNLTPPPLSPQLKVNDIYINLGCYNAVPNGPIVVPINKNGSFNYNDNKIEAVYFDDGVRVFTNCDKTDDLTKHANGAKNIYLFSFDIKEPPIDLGVVDSIKYSTEEWIKNNVKGEIYYNNENWGYCTVKSSDTYNNYTYTIICREKQTKTETINLGIVDNKQVATEEWIKNNVQGTITYNDKDWGNCCVTSTDVNYIYKYLIKCRLKETKPTETIDLGIVDKKQIFNKENIEKNMLFLTKGIFDIFINQKEVETLKWIKNNVKGEIYYNDKNWGNCIAKSTDSNCNYTYIIKCREQETKNVILDPSDNPYETIQKWKKDKNILSTIIKESPFEWKDGDNFNLTQTVETKDVIYHINCRSTYKEKLDRWKNQCYFKPGVHYDRNTIRVKLGRYSQTIYDEKNNKLWYKYNEGWFSDSWNIYDTNGKIIFEDVTSSMDKIDNGFTEATNRYCDTTKPPIKEECIQDLTQINEQINKQQNEKLNKRRIIN
ncbi:hypothetical protein [Candidatus Phytoplasma sp. AldY-WA1]|uniref:hypothetical protein n=1 Tax=Candidatus Phytoplasma sp. AldY-WA1 TaxID=2852100 RepID=UPI00254A5172|nr:hypothetical protein [Candidatus Phytoplasma sp. AldY-WA1]